jgi:hypothetical protein
VFIVLVAPRGPGLFGPGLASFSPFLAVMMATIEMQIGPASEWAEAVGWVTLWIAIDAALAAFLLKAVLISFNRCLGRVEEGRGLDRYGLRTIPRVARRIEGPLGEGRTPA